MQSFALRFLDYNLGNVAKNYTTNSTLTIKSQQNQIHNTNNGIRYPLSVSPSSYNIVVFKRRLNPFLLNECVVSWTLASLMYDWGQPSSHFKKTKQVMKHVLSNPVRNLQHCNDISRNECCVTGANFRPERKLKWTV